MKKLLSLFICVYSLSLFSAEGDSISKKSVIVVPIGYYTPETGPALGAAGGYYFKSNDIKKISSVSYSAIYTWKNQFIFHAGPRIYSKNKKYYILGDFKARYYPDKYYASGDDGSDEGIDYISEHVQINIQPQRFLTKKWAVGLNYFMRYEDLETDNYAATYYPKLWGPAHFVQGLGFLSSYDSRDNLFYPEKGFFGKISTWSAIQGFGSDYTVHTVNIDLRQFLSLAKKHILAYQLYYAHVGGNAPLFNLYPTIGGSDKLRGFREGMFRNSNMILLQGEYRYPIYKRLKGVVFGGVGQLFYEPFPADKKLKVSYGAGLRYRLNDARVHLRFDYAFTNYKESNFYITATEAF